MDPMKALSARRAINNRLKKKSVYRHGAMAVTRGRMFTAEVLAGDVSVVM